MKKFHGPVLGLLLIIVSISCAPRYIVKDLSLEELLEALEKRGRGVGSLKGFISAEFKGKDPHSQGTIEGILLFRTPDSLRFQGLNPFGFSILDLSIRGEEFKLYFPEANQIITGDNSFMENMPLLPISPGELLDIFRYPLLEKGKKVFSMKVSEDGYMLYQSDHERQSSIEKKTLIDRRTLLIKKEYIYNNDDGSLDREMLYNNYQRVDGTLIPHSIVINKPVEQLTIRLTFKKIVVNPAIKEEDFSIATGDGVEVIDINKR